MRRILFIAVALIFAALPAIAQQRVYTALGYQQISVTSGSAVSLTIPTAAGGASAWIVEVCNEAQPLRYRDDGTAPTTTVGVPIAANFCFQYAGAGATTGLGAIQFIAQNTSSTLNVSYYR